MLFRKGSHQSVVVPIAEELAPQQFALAGTGSSDRSSAICRDIFLRWPQSR
jgi:hypothetical protein